MKISIDSRCPGSFQFPQHQVPGNFQHALPPSPNWLRDMLSFFSDPPNNTFVWIRGTRMGCFCHSLIAVSPDSENDFRSLTRV
jgi:hypothetical protein